MGGGGHHMKLDAGECVPADPDWKPKSEADCTPLLENFETKAHHAETQDSYGECVSVTKLLTDKVPQSVKNYGSSMYLAYAVRGIFMTGVASIAYKCVYGFGQKPFEVDDLVMLRGSIYQAAHSSDARSITIDTQLRIVTAVNDTGTITVQKLKSKWGKVGRLKPE